MMNTAIAGAAGADLLADLALLEDKSLTRAIAAGCAIVAYADGWVTGEERRQMLHRLRSYEAETGLDLEAVAAQFERLMHWFDDDPDEGERKAFELIHALAGRRRKAFTLVQTCCTIAEADGGFDAAEREAAARICTALGLDPRRFDLADAP